MYVLYKTKKLYKNYLNLKKDENFKQHKKKSIKNQNKNYSSKTTSSQNFSLFIILRFEYVKIKKNAKLSYLSKTFFFICQEVEKYCHIFETYNLSYL